MTWKEAPMTAKRERRSMLPIPCLTALTVLAVACESALASGYVVYRKVAITGQQAPGTEPGVVFDNFAHGYTFPEPAPVVDDEGHVAFFAFLRGPGVSSSNGAGIWTEDAASVVLAA